MRWGYYKIVLLAMMVSACSSGSSDSGAGENAIDDASGLVGTYKGVEDVYLYREADRHQQDHKTSEVTVVISDRGVLTLSTSGGTTGSAQITNGQTFSLRADARTQFDGQCTAGTILLNGNVRSSEVTADYSSQDLICNGEAYLIEGQLKAVR